jgi:hypothetical protein
VLGLCGKDFKFKTKWDDIPLDKPICRECVDLAIGALTEADEIIQMARVEFLLTEHRLKKLSDVLTGPEDGLILDGIAERDEDHRARLAERFLAEHEQEKAQKTCTCTWTTPEIFTVDPNCPIHGGHSDAIGIELPESNEDI